MDVQAPQALLRLQALRAQLPGWLIFDCASVSLCVCECLHDFPSPSAHLARLRRTPSTSVWKSRSSTPAPVMELSFGLTSIWTAKASSNPQVRLAPSSSLSSFPHPESHPIPLLLSGVADASTHPTPHYYKQDVKFFEAPVPVHVGQIVRARTQMQLEAAEFEFSFAIEPK